MQEIDFDEKVRKVLLYIEGVREGKEICAVDGVPLRTFRRWVSRYRENGVEGLKSRKRGPRSPPNSISKVLENKILRLKQEHPSWGARRIKYQYDIRCHWMTVHRVIRRHHMLIRIKKKPQPKPKRFRRKHVDSMWQGDSFQFRISGVGKVYVTGFLDDCSNYRVASGAYLHKGAKEALHVLGRALARRRIPREMYLDNAGQFRADDFKAELAKYHIRPIYGKPYNPKGRGKIESYHKILWSELITQVRFTSLDHFRRELRRFDRRWNNWRKQQGLGWRTPSSIYNDKRYFNKRRRELRECH